ncbi:MAG: DUF177 domain-containing protein [Rhizomicrobium sp.]|jgi:uncharacterized metal-binding protein YceD (DUF177 family)
MHDEGEAPLRHVFDLGNLSHAGSQVTVSAQGDELPRLAEWAGVEAVHSFVGNVALRRLTQTHFAFEADLTADIVQICVVSLEPMETHIERHLARELHFTPRGRTERAELTLAAGDDDVPEEITSLYYDLAAPLLEEFVLAIDPYPRKGGIAFELPQDPQAAPESPFAVLKSLKEGD